MKASNRQSLEDVFRKWEKKGEERRLNVPGNTIRNNHNEDLQPGRTAWQQRFDASALPKRRSNKKRHRATGEINSKDFNSVLSNQVERKFQLIPPIIENPNRTSHPFLSTGCSKCTQKSSQILMMREKVKNSPMRNLLDLSVFCRKNFFRAAFSDVLYVAYLPNRNNRISEIKSTVLKSSRVCSTMHRLATSQDHAAEASDLKVEHFGNKIFTSIINGNFQMKEYNATHLSVLSMQDLHEKEAGNEVVKQTLKQLKIEAKNVIDAMSGTVKGYFIKIATWILFKFFGKSFSSIQVHQGQIAMLHEASKRNIPLVYLPLHKSHLDYVFISFVLSWHGLKVPYIAAGENLKDIPLFSWLMRNMGGFFIRRKLNTITPQDELYRAVMNEYIAQILISGNNLEIFIEGTRSRSGKCYLPKIGVLSSVISAVKEGRVSDILIVPVNISYEKLLENGFSDEMLGNPKRAESFLQTVKNIWRIFRSHFGQVRVDFGLPSSLTEIIHSSECSEAWQTFMKTLNSDQMLTKDTAVIKRSMSNRSLESLDVSTIALTKGIARHVIYECIQNSAIMGTDMVAFLLMTKFRKGVRLKEFASAFELLKKDTLMHKRDYGFSGASEDVILHSIELLGEELVSWNPESRVIKPVLSLPSLLKLAYYSNQVLSVFILESAVACSIRALLSDENVSLSELISQNTTVSRRELLKKTLDLCDLLCKEFIFSPPCVSMETAVMDAIDKFVAADVLNVCEDTSTKSREKQWANRLAVSTAWSDNDESDGEAEIADQEYKINSFNDAMLKLKFFTDILSPIIESYWLTASCLLNLVDVQHHENDFVNFVHKTAVSRVTSRTALFDESCSLVSITNAIQVFKEYDILRQDSTTGYLRVNLKQNDIFHVVACINRYKN